MIRGKGEVEMNGAKKRGVFVAMAFAGAAVLAGGFYGLGYKMAWDQGENGGVVSSSEPFRTFAEDVQVQESEVSQSKRQRKELLALAAAMEKQQPQIAYKDMDDGLLSFYTRPLQASYECYGRFSDVGHAYILGVCTEEKSPFLEMRVKTDSNDYNENYVHLGYERVSGEETVFEPAVEFPGVRRFSWNEDKTLICLSVDQPEAAEIDDVFERLVNRGQGDYLEQLYEKGMQATAPVEGSFLELRKWVQGQEVTEYVSLSPETMDEIMRDSQMKELEYADPAGINVYGSLASKIEHSPLEMAKNGNSIRKPLWDYLQSHGLFRAEGPDVIEGTQKIRIQQRGMEPGLIEDEEVIREVENILKNAELADVTGCPYVDMVTLEKADGSTVELQFAADGCDGFILGDYACYTPGRAEWDRLKGLLEMSFETPAER